jgi:hypothetical protein
MDDLDELTSHLSGASRAIVISEQEVDLRPQSGENRLFLLKIGEGSLAAGGRGGGFGERKVTAVLCFELKDGAWRRIYKADDASLRDFEVPYYVSRLPMTMADGSEAMGYGAIEPDLVRDFAKKAGISSSA